MMKRNKKKEDFHEGFWVAPGGKKEANESIREAAIREVKEETGLRVNNLIFMGFLHFPDFGSSPFGDEWVGIVYKCIDFDGQIMKSSPEGELRWIHEGRMIDLSMWEGDYIFTEFILKDKKFDIKLTYNKSRLVKKQIQLLNN